jgi:asparagine synthetase B (glutamine-hydrolysing)
MVCPDSLQEADCHHDIAKFGLEDFNKFRFRHLSPNYTGTNKPSETILLEKIKAAVKNTLDPNKKPLLLLSDGKDSTAIALAMSELGISCHTLTILRNEDDDLKTHISTFAKKLGHKPVFVKTDEIISAFSANDFLEACGKQIEPVMDQAFFFVFFAIKHLCERTKISSNDLMLVDGSGNDEYFGLLPNRKQIHSYRLSLLNVWPFLQKIKRETKWYMRSPAESQGLLSAISCVFPFPESFSLNQYFSALGLSPKPLAMVDFRAFSRGYLEDRKCVMSKTINVANYFGAQVCFPWAANDLAEYCFNLPVSYKFDFKRLKNKILLRELLIKKLDWKQEKRGLDVYFDLDMASFKEQILSQIMPDKIIREIDKSFFLPEYVKKRAYLELLNFYGFCVARGMAHKDIAGLLFGKKTL